VSTLSATGAIHHIDITVHDLERSSDFYDRILPLLGFTRIEDVPEGPLWAGAHVEVGLQAARNSGAEHDRYSPGLHHLAFTAPTRESVDKLHRQLLEMNIAILDAPAEYPEYCRGYYAVFFADPDGIKLEYVYTPEWPA
jgi:catechol 2,3-dioxygenase-like lactoylglutathione lyase family enzyme